MVYQILVFPKLIFQWHWHKLLHDSLEIHGDKCQILCARKKDTIFSTFLCVLQWLVSAQKD